MRTPSLRPYGRHVALAIGSAAVTIVLFGATETRAEPVTIQERSGEYDERGAKFGDVVVSGELVAANVPSGWVLRRTFENLSDAPVDCEIVERVLQSEEGVGARVSGAGVAVVERRQKIAMGPRAKTSVGVHVPVEIGREITRGRAFAAMVASAPNPYAFQGRTYHSFTVQYLRPLRPGETAAEEWRDLHPGYMP